MSAPKKRARRGRPTLPTSKKPQPLSSWLQGDTSTESNGSAPFPRKGRIVEGEQFVPFREDLGSVPTPQDNIAVSKAVLTVLLYTIVDALDLNAEEEVWLNWNLTETFETFSRKKITNMPLAARQELFKGNYTELLRTRRETFNPERSNASLYSENVTNADVEDWVDNVMSVVQSSYELTAKEALIIKAKFVYIFTNLGVADVYNPRGAAYIPADLKQRVFQKLLD